VPARAVTFAGVLAACSSSAPSDPYPYLHSSSFRRSELALSLVYPANDYSQQRLAHYEAGGASDWSLLPEWNPAAEPIQAGELDAPDGASTSTLSPAAAPLALPDVSGPLDDAMLLALGEVAFTRYPTQLAPSFAVALRSRAEATRYGLWVDDVRGVGGLVRARMADGSVRLSVTCATCHASRSPAGVWSPGLANAALDVGAAILAWQGNLIDPATAQATGAWGPGRLDVTTMTGVEPARIPDLRPVAWLGYLQQDATVRATDVSMLAIRLETLVVTSNEQAVRPPRVVMLALAMYVRTLASTLPPPDAAATASPRGARLFASRCAGCHEPPALTGEPVPLAPIGTDPTLGLSPSRGTGAYRVPSLHGVGTRGPLLHDGTVPSVQAMFDPTRPTPAFTGKLHGSGAVPGHLFGLDLDDADRQALVTYVLSL
jgi:mono/diheme cytochrome c family protein